MKLLHILPNTTFVQAIATNRNVRDKCIYYLQMLNFGCRNVYAMPLGNNDETKKMLPFELISLQDQTDKSRLLVQFCETMAFKSY